MSLTRHDLESKRLQQMIAQSGLTVRALTEEELQTSLDATLSQHPIDTDVWIFAYGSLIWNPCFPFLDRQIGSIHGWHRQFCLWTPLGRGTPDNPGLVLGLDRGGSCRGVIYRIAAAVVRSELQLVWRREMVVGSYTPRWVKVMNGKEFVHAITFTVNRNHSGYAGKLPLSLLVHQLATAAGSLGSCTDYLHQTVAGLAQEGIQDKYLLELCDRVAQAQAASPAKTHPDLGQYYPLITT